MMCKKALLIIDLQRDYFQDGSFPLPAIERASGVAADAIKCFREASAPVIHIRHIELDPAGTFFLPGTLGAEIHPSVKPNSGEILIEKNFPNSFRKTNLADALRTLEIEDLVICGAMSNMCVDATTRAAADFGFNCTVLQDACAASETEFNGRTISAVDTHGAFMGALASAYGSVVSLNDYIAAQK